MSSGASQLQVNKAPWTGPWEKVLLWSFTHTTDLSMLLQTEFLAELVLRHSSVTRGWSPLSQGTLCGGGKSFLPRTAQNLLPARLPVPAWGEGALTGPAHRNKFHPVFRSSLLNTSVVLNDVFYFICRFTL